LEDLELDSILAI